LVGRSGFEFERGALGCLGVAEEQNKATQQQQGKDDDPMTAQAAHGFTFWGTGLPGLYNTVFRGRSFLKTKNHLLNGQVAE
jgi:hypothetical protein